jgi:hypothetical protein
MAWVRQPSHPVNPAIATNEAKTTPAVSLT